MVYEIVYRLQREYANYYERNRIPPNRLMLHKSLVTYLSSQLGETNIGQILGHDVVVVEDEDLFKGWKHMFRWIRVSENKK